MARETDVLISGAGPGGLMAAIKAGEAGARVMVVDRKKVVGSPVHCGEGTFSSVLDCFDLGDGRWIVNRPPKIHFISPRGRKLVIYGPAFKILVLDRILFEQEMARRAKELGVEIMLEKTVLGVGENGPGGASVLLDDGQELRSKVIIGADGVESTVGRSVGLTKPIPIRDMGTAAQYRMRDVDWDQDVVEVHMGEKVAPGGYVWIFPKGGDLLNVGVGSVGVGLKGENMPKPIELLDDFVAKRFPDAEVLEKMAGCVPVGPPLETAAKGRVMLVGDAARHSYAVGGGGIHSALLAGAMAGSCAGRIIKDASLAPIAEYDQMWKKAIYKSLSRSYKRKQWLYRSEKNMERLVTLGKIALPVVRVLPIDILKIWWGKYQPK